jgi:hypothetical protein
MKQIYLLVTLTAACALQMYAMGPATLTAEQMAQAEEAGIPNLLEPLYTHAKPTQDGSFEVSISHWLDLPVLFAQACGLEDSADELNKVKQKHMTHSWNQLAPLLSPEDLKSGADFYLDHLRNHEIPKLQLEFRPSKQDPALHLAVGCFKVSTETKMILSLLIETGYADFNARNSQGQTVFEYARHHAKTAEHPKVRAYFWEALEVLEEVRPVQSPHETAMAYMRQQVEMAAQAGAGEQQTVEALQAAMLILENSRQQAEIAARAAREQENAQKKEQEKQEENKEEQEEPEKNPAQGSDSCVFQ